MSSWCSFRCPCLDELGSKSDLNILYLFLLQGSFLLVDKTVFTLLAENNPVFEA